MKKIIKKYFQYFYYFYSHLRYRMFWSLLLAVLVGLMDGLGLAMFIPLLEMVESTSKQIDPQEMGKLSLLGEILAKFNIPLNLVVVLLIILFFFTMKGILKFFEGFVRVRNEQMFMKNLRYKNIRALANFNFNSFMNADIGRIQNTLTAEVVKVNQGYRYYFMCLQYSVSVAVYIVLAFVANPQFALLVVVGGALSGMLFTRMHKRTKGLSKTITVDSHSFQGLLIQKVAFFKYLKATGLLNPFAKKLEETNNAIEVSQRKAGMINAIMVAIREPLIILVVVLVILVQVFYFSQSIGIIILSLLLFYRALTYLMGLQNFWNLFLGISGSLMNMDSFLNELRSAKEITGSKSFPGFSGKMEISGLHFQYDNKKILRDINLSFNKNETIAIIGESGSGKTTLLNVITGLLKPSAGKIYIDKVGLDEYQIETFQKRIGYITQEPVIFSDTIFNNVSFWSEKNPKNIQRFEEALRKASIFDFVMGLEDREETVIGNNGIKLSGGQKQRLCIARELYKEVDFLFMDEATSALDSETEKMIRENIESLKGKYTIFIVAHRLSTVRDADRIILLRNGKVEAGGTFEDLMDSSLLFKKMVESQGV